MERRTICLRIPFIYTVSAVYIIATCIELSKAEKLNDEECIAVCDSKECVYAAKSILSHMNSDIDACDNFDAYLCGGYQQRFGMDEYGATALDSWTIVLQILKDIIVNSNSEPESAASKMKIVYDSCIKHGSSDIKGIQTFKDILNDLAITNWPKISPGFNFTEYNLHEMIGIISLYTTGGFINIKYENKDRNDETDEKVLKVDFSINHFDHSIQKEELMEVLKYFDLELEDIEIILKDYQDVRKVFYNKYEDISCKDCSEVYVACTHHSNGDWNDFCKTVTTMLKDASWKINTKSDVVLTEKDAIYSKSIFDVLKTLNHRSVANFVAMELLYSNYEHLNFHFRQIKLKYAPRSVAADKDEQCVRILVQYMNLVLENGFFHRRTFEKLLTFYKDYQSKILNSVVSQDWILPDANIKVQKMIKDHSFYIEYMKKVLPNDTLVNEQYKMFHPTEDFFGNVLLLKRFKRMGTCNQNDPEECLIYCHHEYPDDDALCNALSHLAWASWQWNGISDGWFELFRIGIDFGVITYPLSYLPRQRNEINYVTVGGVVAHEFGHGLDKYMKYRAESDDLSSTENETVVNFRKIQECVANAISEFKYNYLNESLDGYHYLDESMADSVGISLIDKYISDSVTEEFLLPGLRVSMKQMLYMSANQMFCGKINKEMELWHKANNPHPPQSIRLLFMTRNSRAFSEIFQCPLGSYMNPSRKCNFLD